MTSLRLALLLNVLDQTFSLVKLNTKEVLIIFFTFLPTGRSDPFVIVRVGDAKQEKYKTKIVYRTLNPVWNEQVTLAMPQKHQRISIEVWDKDPFRQEKMGVVRFHFDDLISLGEGGLTDKHWFDLEQAKSGELQLAFKTVLPDEVSVFGH